MPMTQEALERVATISCNRIFVNPGKTATVSSTDFVASGTALDDKLSSLVQQADVGTKFEQCILSAVPQPVASLSVADISEHFAILIAVRHGAI